MIPPQYGWARCKGCQGGSCQNCPLNLRPGSSAWSAGVAKCEMGRWVASAPHQPLRSCSTSSWSSRQGRVLPCQAPGTSVHKAGHCELQGGGSRRGKSLSPPHPCHVHACPFPPVPAGTGGARSSSLSNVLDTSVSVSPCTFGVTQNTGKHPSQQTELPFSRTGSRRGAGRNEGPGLGSAGPEVAAVPAPPRPALPAGLLASPDLGFLVCGSAKFTGS